MLLGVIAALPNELGATLKALPCSTRKVEHLQCHESPPFVFTWGGIGDRRAAAAALLVADTFKPQALLSIGFCGALRDDLETADLIVGGTTTPARGSGPPRPRPRRRAQGPFGEVLTVPKVMVGADEKKAEAKRTGALIVDMEAEAVAKAARVRGVGFPERQGGDRHPRRAARVDLHGLLDGGEGHRLPSRHDHADDVRRTPLQARRRAPARLLRRA
jgi:hypothetical protein